MKTMTSSRGRVTVLGINGHIGRSAAAAFADAGWEVTGWGRSNRAPLPGVTFMAGDAEIVDDIRRGVADADVVVNALNLPYDKWDQGRMEAQTSRVIEAMGRRSGKTLMFPGNIYNFAATDRVVTPQTPQAPEMPRGAIRVRSEELMRAGAARGDFQLLIIRAGSFFGGGSTTDLFAQGVMREAAKGRVAMMGERSTGHSWAYLPDLGAAFEKVAWHRKDLAASEVFHFAGHFATNAELLGAIAAAFPYPLRPVGMPWGMMAMMGLVMPVMRELVKMRYLWQHSMELKDPRLDRILGPEFGTTFGEAVATAVAPFFEQQQAAA